MVQKYIIDKTDLPKLIRGEELALAQGSKYRAFCIEINEKLTNGDVIKALYGFEPNKNSCIIPKDKCNGNPCECDGCQYNDWWNKPYKEVENE